MSPRGAGGVGAPPPGVESSPGVDKVSSLKKMASEAAAGATLGVPGHKLEGNLESSSSADTSRRTHSSDQNSAFTEESVMRDVMTLPHAFVIADNTQPDCPITSASDGFYEMTGYGPEDVIGKNCRFLQGPDTNTEEVRKLRDAVKAGKSHVCRLRNYRKDGTPFLNMLSISPIYKDPCRNNEGVKPIKFIGVQLQLNEGEVDPATGADIASTLNHSLMVDNLNRKIDEAALTSKAIAASVGADEDSRRQAIDMSSTLERINYSFVVSDPSLPDCPIVFCSDSFLKLTGYSRVEILGKNCRFLQGKDTDQAEVDKIRKATKERKDVRVCLANYRKNGEKFWNIIYIAPIVQKRGKDPKNDQVLFIGVQMDATGRISGDGDAKRKESSEERKAERELKLYGARIKQAVTKTSYGKEEVTGGIVPMRPHFSGEANMFSPKTSKKDLNATMLGKMQYACQDAVRNRARLYKALNTASNGELNLRILRPVRRLGSGDVGTVWLAELKSELAADSPRKRQLYAVKSVNIAEMTRRNKLERLRTEEMILKKVDHPFLLRLFGTIRTKRYLHFVAEHCAGGGLFAIGKTLPGRKFRESQVRFIAAEVTLALQYIHAIGIIYRDIKPENILVGNDGHIRLADFDLSHIVGESGTRMEESHTKSMNGSPSFGSTTSLSDLAFEGPTALRKYNAAVSAAREPNALDWAKFNGLVVSPPGEACGCLGGDAASSDSSDSPGGARGDTESAFWSGKIVPAPMMYRLEPTGRTNSFVGTEEYLAPEVILGKSHGAGVDWWGLGILIYELLYGVTPFVGRVRDMTFHNILNKPLKFPSLRSNSMGSGHHSGGRNRAASIEAMQLIMKLLVHDEAKRLGAKGAEEVKNEPFFRSMKFSLMRCVESPLIDYVKRTNVNTSSNVLKEIGQVAHDFDEF
ncbi:phototropin [Pseudoscourfieldia marina]|uniref:non-specific serine/threonine protein kinase n=1 Tax=Pseudoscourfieldia marina TaxID=41886 RepID=A0A126WYK7_9CHLO|nr:putative LOV domain-containing protein [Pseudoscourfieldia marina]